jgi:acyl-CoA thioesterase
MGFDADTALRTAGDDGVYEGEISESWWTPRGPLGGYVMAIVLRGMELAVAEPGRMPRSLTVSFMRPPVAGPATVRTTVERAGRSLTTVSGRLEQDGMPMALALASFSVPWTGRLMDEAPMPEAEPPEWPRPPRFEPPDGAPPFIQQLSMQQRFGAEPFSGAERSETGGWLGLREERRLDAPAVALLADAWFPSPWTRLRRLAPAPTIEMSVYFRAPLPLDDTLLLARYRSRLVRDGFFDEDGELWAPDGTLVAQSRQLALLIGAEA